MTQEQQPTWDIGVEMPKFPKLSENTEAEVVIIGGGITGITTAYLLSKAGKKVVLAEKEQLAMGATGMTTAFLTQYIDTAIPDLLKLFGEEKTKKIFQSHKDAIQLIEDIVTEEHIECDFKRCSNYVYATSERDIESLREEESAAQQVGLDMTFHQDEKLGFKNDGYLELSNQAKFHPRKYVAALVHILQKNGVQMYEDTEVTDVSEGDRLTVQAGDHTITAQSVVVATYAPFNHELFFKKGLYISYVMEISLPSGQIPEAIYEDMYDPYHYFRVDRGEEKDRIIFGGEDHRKEIQMDPSKNFQSLEDHLKELLPNTSYEIVRKWTGPILEPVDGLAYIGPHENKNIYYATGFSGNGMTYSTIAAKVISDLIQGKKNEWLDVYDANRMPGIKELIYKGRDYTQEFIGGAVKNILKYRKDHSE